jgi:hypothetical protein
MFVGPRAEPEMLYCFQEHPNIHPCLLMGTDIYRACWWHSIYIQCHFGYLWRIFSDKTMLLTLIFVVF